VQKLLSELSRLYLPAGTTSPKAFMQHMADPGAFPISLAASDGSARAVVLAFPKLPGSSEGHWAQLCQAANALQVELGLPAPAVSISGVDGYGLWVSLAHSVPASQLDEFAALLRQTYTPDAAPAPAPPDLPPCARAGTEKWAAFIHSDLGASFADEPWLELAPPENGQVALLEQLESASPEKFRAALDLLRAKNSTMPAAPAAGPSHGVLLADATLEQIVQHLHSKNIEPTFRHLKR
jgi:hypothetical protein